MSADNRFARQIQLPEIGRTGQQAISESSLMVDASADESIVYFAKIYAQAAGLLVDERHEAATELPAELRKAFQHPASRSVGLGAAFALRSVLQAIRSPHSTLENS